MLSQASIARVPLAELKIQASMDTTAERTRPAPPEYGWFLRGLSLVEIRNIKNPNHPLYKQAGAAYKGFNYFHNLHYHAEIGWFFKSTIRISSIVITYTSKIFNTSHLEGQVVIRSAPGGKSPYAFILEHPAFHDFEGDNIFYLMDPKQRSKEEIEAFRKEATLALSPAEIAQIKADFETVKKNRVWAKNEKDILEMQKKIIVKKPSPVYKKTPSAAEREKTEKRRIKRNTPTPTEHKECSEASDEEVTKENRKRGRPDGDDPDFISSPKRHKGQKKNYKKRVNEKAKSAKHAIALDEKDAKSVSLSARPFFFAKKSLKKEPNPIATHSESEHKTDAVTLLPSPTDQWQRDGKGFYLNGTEEQRDFFAKVALNNQLPIAFSHHQKEQQIFIWHRKDDTKGTGEIIGSLESSQNAYNRWMLFLKARIQSPALATIKGPLGLFSPIARIARDKVKPTEAEADLLCNLARQKV